MSKTKREKLAPPAPKRTETVRRTGAAGARSSEGTSGRPAPRSTGELPWVAGTVRPGADGAGGSGGSATESMPWRTGELESPTGKEVQKKSRDELINEKREERLKKALVAEREAAERRTRAAVYIGLLACIPLTIVEYLTSGRLAFGVWAVCFFMTGTTLFMRRQNRLEKLTGLGFIVAGAILLVLRIYLDMR